MFHFVDFRLRRSIGGQEGPGKLARASDGLSHSSSSCRPTVGSSSVPSRDTLTSRPWFHGFRMSRVRKNGSDTVRIHSMRNGRLSDAGAGPPSFGTSETSSETSCSNKKSPETISYSVESRAPPAGVSLREWSELCLDKEDVWAGSSAHGGRVLMFGIELVSLSHGLCANDGRSVGAD